MRFVLLNHLKHFSGLSKLVLLAFLGYLCLAFYTHIYYPVSSRADNMSSAALSLKQPVSKMYTPAMQTWLKGSAPAELTAEQQALMAEQQAAEAAANDTPPLLTQATQLADALIRLRAVFLEPGKASTGFAVFEYQPAKTRQIQFLTLMLNDEIDGYRLSTLSHTEAQLTKTLNDEKHNLTLPVFSSTKN